MNKKFLKLLIFVFVLACLSMVSKPQTTEASPKKAKYTIKKVDKSETFKDKCTIVDNCSYERIVLKGNSAAIKKINKTLNSAYKKAIKSMNHEFASEQAKYGDYDEEYTNKYTTEVTYNNKGVISILVKYDWYQGGVVDYGWRCYTFSLKTGKKLTLSEVTGKSNKSLKKTLKSKLIKKYGTDMFYEDSLDKLSPKKVNFYLKKNKAVVCFSKYEIAFGAAGTQEVSVPSKYK